MPGSQPAAFTFEALADHYRAAFSCGVPELDRYLHIQANQDARRKVAAPFVMLGQSRQILGYYTLSAYGIRLTELPADLARKFPRYPLLPATLLGRLAVSQAHKGTGWGTLLLMDALHRSLQNTRQVASIAVVAEAIDDAASGFYLHHEFIPLAGHPHKLFLTMRTVEKVLT